MNDQDTNQCMGCQGGWPMENKLFHREPGTISVAGLVACSANKYPQHPAIPLPPVAMNGPHKVLVSTPGGDTFFVPEEVVQMAGMACQDYDGMAKARGVLREMYPELTLLQAVAIVNEAARRAGYVRAETLSDEIIRQELEVAMQGRLSKSRADRLRADRVISMCREALGGNHRAKVLLADYLNARGNKS